MDKGARIADLSQLLQLKLEGVQITKVVTADCPWNEKVKTNDLKLDLFGTMEDTFYPRVPGLIQNVRRGNTIIEIRDEHGNISHTMGRKGLMKFFDLRLNFVSQKGRHSVESMDQEHQVQKNLIMAPVLRSL